MYMCMCVCVCECGRDGDDEFTGYVVKRQKTCNKLPDIYIYIFVSTYIHMYKYIPTHISIYLYMYAYIFSKTHVACRKIYSNICIYVYRYSYIHALFVYTYIRDLLPRR